MHIEFSCNITKNPALDDFDDLTLQMDRNCGGGANAEFRHDPQKNHLIVLLDPCPVALQTWDAEDWHPWGMACLDKCLPILDRLEAEDMFFKLVDE
jgi:hypothetical protein